MTISITALVVAILGLVLFCLPAALVGAKANQIGFAMFCCGTLAMLFHPGSGSLVLRS